MSRHGVLRPRSVLCALIDTATVATASRREDGGRSGGDDPAESPDAGSWFAAVALGEDRLATLEAECARLLALGGAHVRLLPADDDNESRLVMQNIEGNEFDLD